MRTRLAAATAGAVLIAAAVLAFSLGKHPVIAGTNSAAPLLPALRIPSGQTRCQTVSRVPPGATHVRVVVSTIAGPPGILQVRIGGPQQGRAAVGQGRLGLDTARSPSGLLSIDNLHFGIDLMPTSGGLGRSGSIARWRCNMHGG